MASRLSGQMRDNLPCSRQARLTRRDSWAMVTRIGFSGIGSSVVFKEKVVAVQRLQHRIEGISPQPMVCAHTLALIQFGKVVLLLDRLADPALERVQNECRAVFTHWTLPS